MTHTPLLATIIVVLTWGLGLAWLYKSTRALFGIGHLPDLNEVDLSSLPEISCERGPHLTVIVPACNEEQAVGSSLASLLAQEDIRLQVVAVDDRSTDETAACMEAVAALLQQTGSPHVLKVIRNRELPSGWLGKPHAVSLGIAEAAAPWILLTDADMHFAPHCLARAVRLAEARRADHLVLLPTLIRSNWRESAMVAVFQVLTHWSMRVWKVEDPKARDFLGVGGFNLIRASALQAIGGIEKVRLEVVEDMSIGWLVKHHGFRSCVALGPNQATIRWFEGVSGIVANLEKNGFAAFRFQLPIILVMLPMLGLQIVLPFAALFCGWLGVGATAAMYTGLIVGYRANRKVNAASPVLALTYAPALAVLCWAFLRSTVLTLKRGGVSWRGTFYPLAELKRGMIPWRAF